MELSCVKIQSQSYLCTKNDIQKQNTRIVEWQGHHLISYMFVYMLPSNEWQKRHTWTEVGKNPSVTSSLL